MPYVQPLPPQSPGHVSGLLSVCLAWRRLQSALLRYSPAYRAEVMTSSEDAVMTSPLAPLGEKRWGKLTRLPAAEGEECGQLMVRGVGELGKCMPNEVLLK